MKKIIFLTLFLLAGLVTSQVAPGFFREGYTEIRHVLNFLMFTCLAYIMINVGREFELDKTRWKSYTTDYFIAMATAAVPWVFVASYYIWFLPMNDLKWDQNLLISRFAAPTSAGILFTMLAACGLKKEWIYKKTQTLAIFDDLDTILLMIPLQILMIGFKWQLFVVVLVVCGLLWFAWRRLGSLNLPSGYRSILLYSVLLVAAVESLYLLTRYLMGPESGIHIEVLLPAFVLGMVMKTHHDYGTDRREEKISNVVSFVFMFLVGMSTPMFINLGANAGFQLPSWGILIFHVLMVTFLSNLGKMFPLFFYRDRDIRERLALSIGMFTRGEVGAGIIVIALGYHLQGIAVIVSLLTLVTNLVLTGLFVMAVKRISQRVYKKNVLLESETRELHQTG